MCTWGVYSLSMANRTIVIAWTETEQHWDGEAFAADMGHIGGLVDVKVARACIWLNSGTAADIKRAKAYAKTEGHAVYTFSTKNGDPLGAAKRKALKAA